MDRLLEIIYDNYYNLINTLGFVTDKEYIRFVYNLRNINEDEFDPQDFINNYEDNIGNKLMENINGGIKDKFFSEKEFLHLTYPLEQTLRRFQILYITVGEEEWKKIFKFDYKFFIDFICWIIYRIILYNDYKITNDKERKLEYQKLFPLSTNFFITKKELYSYFSNNNDSVDKILELLSIEIDDIKKLKDTYRILKNNNKYVLYFLWDFIYNSYDLIENTIVDYYKRDNKVEDFYKKRGLEFEKYCFQKLVKTFPKTNIYRKLYYDDKNGNHEIDILMETNEEFIVFECKSSRFDIHTTNDDNELKKEFLRAFGNGYKTINDFNDYINNDNIKLYSRHNKKTYSFDFKKKKVFYINITLHNIEYLQTSVQKIDKKLIIPVKVYPINWNFIDFLTIMELAKMNPNPIFEYIDKRFKMINENKEITFDTDEIDVLGFLTDDQNTRVYKMIIENSNKVDTTFTISNGIYREQINSIFNRKMLDNFFINEKKEEADE